MDNLTIITNEFNELKGQFVICSDRVYRFIGIADDEEDWYYSLYDGRKITLHSCVGSITPLKGYILDNHYKELIRIAKINHYDQPEIYGYKKEAEEFNEQHKKEITTWEDTRFILGPHWELN
jgi:hypothetical protein